MRRPTCRLSLERLERRDVPAGGLIGPLPAWYFTRATFDAATRTVAIDGSPFDDAVRVRIESGLSSTADRVIVSVNDNDILDVAHLRVQRFSGISWTENNVTAVTFRGNSGNDSFENATAIPVTASGGLGDDTLTGGEGSDDLSGDDGNDILIGGTSVWAPFGTVQLVSGNDVLRGGAGNDRMWGRDGQDWIMGEVGADELFGEGGNDWLEGGDNGDTLNGGAGNDMMLGGGDADYLFGDGDNDWLYGDGGNDVVFGGTGDDSLWGGAGVDQLNGQGGRDALRGDADLDYLRGGDEDDWLDGGAGPDRLSGENGADSLLGGTEDDFLWGGTGNDTLSGEGGVDRLWGEGDDDWLYGGSDYDFLDGGAGTDAADAIYLADGLAGVEMSTYRPNPIVVNGALESDIHQRGQPHCVFYSALAGLAGELRSLGRDLAAERIAFVGYQPLTGQARYTVKMFTSNGARVTREVGFSGFGAKDAAPVDNEIWVTLAERAYLDQCAAESAFSSWGVADFRNSLVMLTGAYERDSAIAQGAFWDGFGADDFSRIAAAVDANKVVTCGTWTTPFRSASSNAVYLSHAYTVVAVDRTRQEVRIRNPWGYDLNGGAAVDGDHRAYGDPGDGYIWLSWANFAGSMQAYAYAAVPAAW